MRRIAPSPFFGIVALLSAGVASCSSDEARKTGSDGGDASLSGGSTAASGAGGTGGGTSSTGGTTGGAGSGGRADGGSATGARAGSGGHAGASGAPSSGGKGGQSAAGAGGAAATEDGGGACTDTPPAVLCIRGSETASTGETIKVGDKLIVDVRPRGCFSSSCTAVRTATCSIAGTAPFVVDAQFCLANTAGPGGACTTDCSGGGVAHCEAATLTAGQHTVQLGGLSVGFNVPALVPFGGECIGSAF